MAQSRLDRLNALMAGQPAEAQGFSPEPQPSQQPSGSLVSRMARLDALTAGQTPEVAESASSQALADYSFWDQTPVVPPSGPQVPQIAGESTVGLPETVQPAPRTLGQEVADFNILDALAMLPFSPTQDWEKKGYATAKERLALGEYGQRHAMTPMGGYATVQMPATSEQLRGVVKEYEQKRQQGATVPAQIFKGATQLPAYMGEFALGGAAGKAVGLAGKGVKGAVTAAGMRTLLQPQRVSSAIIDQQQKGEQPTTALLKAYGDVYIENLSEAAGGAVAPALRKLPFGGKLLDAMTDLARKTGIPENEFIQRISTKAGWNGLAAEWGEERLGTILRAVTDVDDFGAGKDSNPLERLAAGLTQDLQVQNQLVELGVLSIPALGKRAASALVSREAKDEPIVPVTPEQKPAEVPPAPTTTTPTKAAAVAAPEAGKEPWQMTSTDYVFEKVRPDLTVKPAGYEAEHYRAEHKAIVRNAVAAGRPVPPEVLADYPDLAKEATRGPEKPAVPAEVPAAGVAVRPPAPEAAAQVERKVPEAPPKPAEAVVAEKTGEATKQEVVKEIVLSADPKYEGTGHLYVEPEHKFKGPNKWAKQSVGGALTVGSWFKKFASIVPEFTQDPVFTIDETGDFIWQDGGRYRIKPEMLGLTRVAAPGRKIRVDLASFGIKPASESKIAQAGKTGLAAPAQPMTVTPALPRVTSGVTQRVTEGVTIPPAAPQTKGTEGRMGSPGALGQYNEIDVGRLKVSMEPKAEPTSARSVLDYVRRSFAVPMKGKATHKMRIYAGWFDPKAVGIRLKDQQTIATAIHEIGHYIDWHLNKRWSLKPPSPEINKELLALGKALYGKKNPPGGYKSEGWAEFMREYVTGEEAQTKAPALHEFFTKDYLPSNPDVAEKIAAAKQMIADFRFQGAEARVESQINRSAIKGPLRERISQALQWANTVFRDELAPLKRVTAAVARELRPSESPYELGVAFTSKAPAKAREFVLTGTTDLAGNRKGPSLKEAVSGIDRKDFRTFTRWIYAKEALFRWSQGKNPGISKADAQYVYDKYKSPEWEKTADAVTHWNRDVLDYLVDAGGFDPKIRDLLKDTPVYIPLFRAFAQGETRPMGMGTGRSIAQPSKPVKRMKGSGRETVDPFESMIQQAERFISVAHKAMVAKALAKLGDEPGMAGWIWKVPAPKEAVKFTSEKIKNDIRRIAVERLGLDPTEIPTDFDEPWDDLITIWQNASEYYGKDNIVSLFADGKRQWFEVHPDLYKAIEGLDRYSLPWYLGIFGKATRAVRLGATGLNPAFGLVRNFIRDAMTALVTAEHARYGPVSSLKGAIKDIAKTESARKFKAMGGKMAAQVLNDRIATQRLRDELTGNWTMKTARHPVEAIRDLFGVAELGPRIEEFEKALEFAEQKYGKGTLDASIYALNAAQDVTTNFSRHGSIGKALNEMIPFFNAGIQGPDKVIRTFGKHPGRTTAVALAGLTLPALILWWLDKDEEWYAKLSDAEKANYLHFRVPGTEKIVRIPLPFELGYVFQSLPVAVLDRMYREDKGQVMDILEIAAERSNPLDWPAAAGPMIDIIANRSWTGAPIVSEAMKEKLPEDRSRPYTTSPMRFLGRLFGIAPVQLEYLVDSYSGGLYNRVARTGDMLTGKAQELEASDIPVIGTLFVRSSDRPTEKLDDFYRRLGLLNQKAGSEKITGAELYERHELNAAGRELSEVRKRLDDPMTTKATKKGLYAEMNRIVTAALEIERTELSREDMLEYLASMTYEDDYRGMEIGRWLPHKDREDEAAKIKQELGEVTKEEFQAWRKHHAELRREESRKRYEILRENQQRKRNLRAVLSP